MTLIDIDYIESIGYHKAEVSWMQEFEMEFPVEMVEEIEGLLKETGENFSDFLNRVLMDALREGRFDGR